MYRTGVTVLVFALALQGCSDGREAHCPEGEVPSGCDGFPGCAAVTGHELMLTDQQCSLGRPVTFCVESELLSGMATSVVVNETVIFFNNAYVEGPGVPCQELPAPPKECECHEECEIHGC